MKLRTYPVAAGLALLATMTFSTGCHKGMAKSMDSWVGSTVGQLVEKWGAPDTSIKLDDGSSMLTWKNVWHRNNYRHECRQSFKIGPDGRVTTWSYQDC